MVKFHIKSSYVASLKDLLLRTKIKRISLACASMRSILVSLLNGISMQHPMGEVCMMGSLEWITGSGNVFTEPLPRERFYRAVAPETFLTSRCPGNVFTEPFPWDRVYQAVAQGIFFSIIIIKSYVTFC
jgi:hypothetical protein